jgi:hypothetical protein
MKLMLNLDTLQVESFDTLPEGGRGRGTVHGHDATNEYDSCACTKEYDTCHVSCDPCATCDTSCAGGPFCDCLPSGCPSCQTSCAGGPLCDCAPTPTCTG